MATDPTRDPATEVASEHLAPNPEDAPGASAIATPGATEEQVGNRAAETVPGYTDTEPGAATAFGSPAHQRTDVAAVGEAEPRDPQHATDEPPTDPASRLTMPRYGSSGTPGLGGAQPGPTSSEDPTRNRSGADMASAGAAGDGREDLLNADPAHPPTGSNPHSGSHARADTPDAMAARREQQTMGPDPSGADPTPGASDIDERTQAAHLTAQQSVAEFEQGETVRAGGNSGTSSGSTSAPGGHLSSFATPGASDPPSPEEREHSGGEVYLGPLDAAQGADMTDTGIGQATPDPAGQQPPANQGGMLSAPGGTDRALTSPPETDWPDTQFTTGL